MNRFAWRERVTIADVARRAGVSKTTVSHVLSGNRPVSVPTRHRVETAIRDLGFRPHGVARSLRTRTSHLVALVIPDITNPFYPVVARAVEEGLGGGRYRTLICNTDRHPEREVEYLQEMADRGVDGVVLDSFRLGPDRIHELVPDRIPVVCLGPAAAGDGGFDRVQPNDERGARDATALLIRVSGRRVAMIQGPPGAGASRNAGYLGALERENIPVNPELVLSGGWTRQGGRSAMRRLLALSDPPTGVFCANDLMALGALDAVREVGASVPADVAVVGFDDIDAASLSVPGLTTVANPGYETGLTAGVMLKERMNGQFTGPPRVVTLPCRLVRRATA